jgi:hypothetical protein
MTFYTGKQFPARYQGGFFSAQHGSWNRTTPVGARVMFTSLKPDGTADKTEVFAEGLALARRRVSRAARGHRGARPTARCSSPTTSPGRSTGSPTGIERATPPRVPRPARGGPGSPSGGHGTPDGLRVFVVPALRGEPVSASPRHTPDGAPAPDPPKRSTDGIR